MSAPTTKEQILFEQRILACGGFYKGKLDGLWGKQSEAAAQAAEANYRAIRQNLGEVDARSEKNIATLLPAMQKAARKIVFAGNKWGKAKGLTVKILSGTRTYVEQNVLFNQRPVVTRARGGQSNHNFGIAIDIGIFDVKGKYYTGASRAEEKAYADVAVAIKAAVDSIEWGGDWRSFKDAPHYQLATGRALAQVRVAFESGSTSFA